MVTRKSRREIEKMRQAGRIVAEVLALVESELKPGVSTAHLDRLAERHIRSAGAVPSFKGYGHRSNPFPASLCISLDEEVVHGIPGERTIREGQIVSVDAGAIYDGWHGDGARTFLVGSPSNGVSELVDTTRVAMMAGIAAAVPGAHLADISAAIEDVARPHGYGIVRQFVGHGIGTEMHQEPQVPNYRTGVRGMKLVPGICLAIEPMLTLGTGDVEVKPDGWTVVTSDGSLAAHFEHTIAVTEQGPEILTTISTTACKSRSATGPRSPRRAPRGDWPEV
jgi:methionyl aminopeptidase